MIYEEWAVEFFKKDWEDDFIDFESSIRKVRQNDETFTTINDEDSIYNILRSK